MKKFVDFENNDGPLGKVIDQIIGIESASGADDADVIITDSVDKLLEYLQTTEKKVIQFCWDKKYPMTHLVEQYPDRFRVVDYTFKNGMPDLNDLIKPISEIVSME